MLAPNTNSYRSKRRKKRGFTASRPTRRGQDRLKARIRGYEEAIKASTSGGKGYRKPGAIKMW